MISSINLKNGKELKVLLDNPVQFAVLMKIAIGEEIYKKSEPYIWLENMGYIIDGVIKGTIISRNSKRKKDTLEALTLRRLNDLEAVDIPSKELLYFEIATAFQERIIDNLETIGARTKTVKSATFKSWVDPIRLMMKSDEVTKEQLIEVWKFLKHHTFWSTNIQSTSKLRKQFQLLHTQAKANEAKSNSENNGEGGNISSQYKQKILDQL